MVALDDVKVHATVDLGRPGGTRFDHLVRAMAQ